MAYCYHVRTSCNYHSTLIHDNCTVYIAWYRLLGSPFPWHLSHFLSYWIITAVLGVVAIGPQVLYFASAIPTYCPSLISTSSSSLVQDRPWCTAVIPNLSAMYMFIQREYWNVGWFRYYEFKQLPNFILASPMLLFSMYAILHWLTKIQITSITPYYVHWGVLLVNAIVVVHIQVTTRLLAACPPVYWASAMLMTSSSTKTAAAISIPAKGRVFVAYSLLYCVLGAGLFSSFYPWT